jgi:hypothetical protein
MDSKRFPAVASTSMSAGARGSHPLHECNWNRAQCNAKTLPSADHLNCTMLRHLSPQPQIDISETFSHYGAWQLSCSSPKRARIKFGMRPKAYLHHIFQTTFQSGRIIRDWGLWNVIAAVNALSSWSTQRRAVELHVGEWSERYDQSRPFLLCGGSRVPHIH